tara:strand:- start:1305 stop:2021 length:717 start_codon:yes stop_codon:yes gene_type:complete
MSHLILVRHGQSKWNAQKRFTGWVDIDLTEKGKEEAKKASELLIEKNFKIGHFFSSYQKRAINTLEIILSNMKIDSSKIIKAWELNERHYGILTGLNKDQMKKKLGEKKILEFRRSWDICPEPLSKDSPYHPLNISVYKNIPREKIPDTESLKATYKRVVPFFQENIAPILKNETVLISGHGNSLRSLCKFLFNIDEKLISKLEIPTGNPLVIDFKKNFKLSNAYYLDKERSKNLIIF